MSSRRKDERKEKKGDMKNEARLKYLPSEL
jgi:hypothetical protein